MKFKLLALLAASAFVFSVASHLALACEGEAHASSSGDSKHPSLALTEAGAQQATFEVKGMSCASCEKAIQAALRKIEGVKNVTFLKPSKSGTRIAQVTFEKGSQVATEVLTQAIKSAGYGVL
jgi:mercuric ion transport protein